MGHWRQNEINLEWIEESDIPDPPKPDIKPIDMELNVAKLQAKELLNVIESLIRVMRLEIE